MPVQKNKRSYYYLNVCVCNTNENLKMRKFTLLLLLFIVYGSVTASGTYKSESVLSSGNWIKVSTSARGIYKITYNQLTSWGVSSPEKVALYSNQGFMLPKMNNVDYPDDLEKIPIIHAKDNAGNNAVFFYSSGSVSWKYDEYRGIFVHDLNLYSDKTYFYITADKTKSDTPVAKSKPVSDGLITVSNFNDFQLYEEENINIGETGRIWYSDHIRPNNPTTKEFTLLNVNTDSKATLTISAGATSSANSQFKIDINNTETATFPFLAKTREYVQPLENDYKIIPAGNIKIKINYSSTASSGDSWLDFITLNYTSRLALLSYQLSFQNINAKSNTAITYQIEASTTNPVLWDISNPVHPTSVAFSKADSKISFTDNGLSIPSYILFDTGKSGFPVPSFVENVANQNLHGLPAYDMLIVSHPKFTLASESLAEFHRQNDQLKVLVVNPNEIYNEFSSGLPDISGIRNMVRMFYNRAKDSDVPLKYLLLMGDGSYNNRDLSGSYSNYLPTYQSAFTYSGLTFITDDFFALLDEDEGEMDGQIDIGVGRIPCQTLTEAQIVVDKTKSYSQPTSLGDWRNIMAFLADDETDEFMRDSEELIEIVNSNYTGIFADKIYFDAYNQVATSGGELYPDVNKTINQRIDEGALIVNYMGHANEFSMAHEDVMTISDVNSWNNEKKLPIFVTATCEFSRFDFNESSIGEEILFHPAGGGVALFSTTRLVYSGPNKTLSENFYRNAFKHDANGNLLRLGDIMRLAKNATSNSGYNKRSFTLLGDPALRLAFPKYRVMTRTINGTNISENISVGALDKVTVTGDIVGVDNMILSDFNGKISMIVYDKVSNVQTLGNDGYRKFAYTVQNNILYKGLSTVNNGHFSFSFVIPKDIAYNVDKGRILYYTTNELEDGTGSSDDFIIAGSSKNPVIDNNPPEMKIFINNENFKNYDKVTSSSLLMANLFDESGINTAGTGIGHNIIAVIDDDQLNQIVLNDFYVAEANTYQRGKILYPLTDLESGEHKISIKAWDIQNNSITEEIYFTVGEGFKVLAVTNAPNPVQYYTEFTAEHNLPGNTFNTTVEIFDLSGKKIDEIYKTIGSYGTTEITIRWDISNINYPLSNNSYLIYRITLENKEGLTATGAGKLIINK